MASATLFTLPAGTYSVGVHPIPSTPIAQGATTIQSVLDLTGRSAASALDLKLDYSPDGQTWELNHDEIGLTGPTPNCGPDEGPIGPCPTMTSTETLPNPELSTRRIRGAITISGAAFVTKVASTVSVS